MPYVNVYVDDEAVIEALSIDDLEEELRKRRAEPGGEDDTDDDTDDDTFAKSVEEMLLRGDADGALLFVQRWLRPKFKSTDECALFLTKARAMPAGAPEIN